MINLNIELWSVMYLVSGMLSFFLMYVFIKSRNGWLRKSMIFIFAGYGIGLFLRGLGGILSMHSEGWGLYVILVPFLSLLFGSGYIFQRYFSGNMTKISEEKVE